MPKLSRTEQFVTDFLAKHPSGNDKDYAIAFIARLEAKPDTREALWRIWCRFTYTSVLRSDLTRVREARRRDRQTSFDW